jgi:hypothetical protein
MTCVERLIGRAVALVPVSVIRAPFLARLPRKIAGEAGHGGPFCVRRHAPALLSAGMTAGSRAVPVEAVDREPADGSDGFAAEEPREP